MVLIKLRIHFSKSGGSIPLWGCAYKVEDSIYIVEAGLRKPTISFSIELYLLVAFTIRCNIPPKKRNAARNMDMIPNPSLDTSLHTLAYRFK